MWSMWNNMENLTFGYTNIKNDSIISEIDGQPVIIPTYISILGTVIGIFIIIIGIFGNILIILSVVLVKQLYKMSNSFIISLAVWDLMQNVLVKPLYVHTYVTGQWTFGAPVCLYALYTSNLAILESILHVCAVAFHRYLVIVHNTTCPIFHRQTGVACLLLAVNIIPICLVLLPSIPRLTTQPLVMHKTIVFNYKIMFCSFVTHSDFRLGGVLKKVLFLVTAALLILYCYVRIYLKVRHSGMSVYLERDRSIVLSPARIRRELTLFKTILVVFLTFVFSFLSISTLYGLDTNRDFPCWVYFIGTMMLWLSSSINWIIYGVLNRNYAMAYRYLVCWRRLPRSQLRATWSKSHSSVNGVTDRRL